MSPSPLNREAIFSDETRQFVSPYDPQPGDEVRLTLRTAKGNVALARVHIIDTQVKPGETIYRLRPSGGDEFFDYHSVSIPVKNPIRYYYSITHDEKAHYYNKAGLCDVPDGHYHFRLIPGQRVPDWARGAVMYQIFVDRFYNGDTSNDVADREYAYLGTTAKAWPWDKDIQNLDVCNFCGGDLRGVIQKMPYLKELGVEVIYLNPIFVSPSNHKYDAQDYDYVDPHYGVIEEDGGDVLRFERVQNTYATKYLKRVTSMKNLEASNALMVEFIETAHRHGLRVILDGVFNHCGDFNKWMDKAGFYKTAGWPDGAYHSASSPYRDYFLWHKPDPGEWPNNESYDGWWGNTAQPKLNFEDSPALCDYVLEIAKKWVSPPYNADGWRLDVAADLGRTPAFNHAFWARFRKAVKEANPNAIILAEHYHYNGDPMRWLGGDQWDTLMNYDAFMVPLTWFLTGVCKHSEESRPFLKNDAMAFENAMRYHMADLPVHALESAMNQLSNHDHSRFLTRTNGMVGRLHTVGPRAAERDVNKNIMMEAIVFQMTWPGAPTLYYGDEAGVMGWTDPDNRRTFPWGQEDPLLMELHRELIALRKRFPMLRHGSVMFLWNNTGFLSYARWDENQKIIVALNNTARPLTVQLPVWKIGVSGYITQLLGTHDNYLDRLALRHPVKDGFARLIVPAQGAFVLEATH
ncbi:MAG: glycoside hydrolase family 13 protein [Defluviitaleaceae bacterium]|nr:glycoside hydrolase family 13 protein [Defluviitaleaceae bacterium]MCL2240842.1 glycoside hydrolase family 13 protein [Defluviitaleaceae bacterium]